MVAQPTIRNFTKKRLLADNATTTRAYQIVEYAHESCKALLEAFAKLKGDRKGAATDEEQDVLRAMLISAGAELDSAVKQLFKDSLQQLIVSNNNVREGFERFVDKALRKGSGEIEIDTKLLARALVTPLPIIYLSERYIYDLTGSSLQSADQLFAACSALGIEPKKDAKLDKEKL